MTKISQNNPFFFTVRVYYLQYQELLQNAYEWNQETQHSIRESLLEYPIQQRSLVSRSASGQYSINLAHTTRKHNNILH